MLFIENRVKSFYCDLAELDGQFKKFENIENKYLVSVLKLNKEKNKQKYNYSLISQMSLIYSKSYYSKDNELVWIDKLNTKGVATLLNVLRWKKIYQNYSVDTGLANPDISINLADRFNKLFISVRKILFIRNTPAHPTRDKIFKVKINNKLNAVYDFEKLNVKTSLTKGKEIIEYVKRIKNAIEKVKIK